MNRFDGILRWAWSILVVCTLAFALGGCDGDDGAAGAPVQTGRNRWNWTCRSRGTAWRLSHRDASRKLSRMPQ